MLPYRGSSPTLYLHTTITSKTKKERRKEGKLELAMELRRCFTENVKEEMSPQRSGLPPRAVNTTISRRFLEKPLNFLYHVWHAYASSVSHNEMHCVQYRVHHNADGICECLADLTIWTAPEVPIRMAREESTLCSCTRQHFCRQDRHRGASSRIEES